MRPFALVSFGITLLLAGFAASWVQDAAAPWRNLGEAAMTGTVSFQSGGGRYRVISSGPSRPELLQTGCTITHADGATRRALGGSGGVNQRSALGVSRVLEFHAAPGPTQVTCTHRIRESSTFGRFQVVAADGLLSRAILGAFVGGAALLAAGALWLFALWRRTT